MNCHNCATPIAQSATISADMWVSSDCQKVNADLTLGQCERCGLMQKSIDTNWQASCDHIYKNYNIYHQANGQEQKVRSVDKPEFSTRSSQLTNFLERSASFKPDGRVIDIGCGNGAFLKAFHANFADWELFGMEINDSMREQIESISAKSTFVPADQLKSQSHKFDLATMIHCIEHIPATAVYLRNLHSILGKDGMLLIQVPDAELNPFDLTIADHASHFSKAALSNIVTDAGYEIIACGNVVLGKEITLLAKSSPGAQQARQPVAGGTLLECYGWLEQLRTLFLAEARVEPIGIFGSSIAATWLAGQFPEKVAFFVDEDENRIGRSHMDRPIIGVSDVPAGAKIFMALEPNLARLLAEKLRDSGIWPIVPSFVTKREAA